MNYQCIFDTNQDGCELFLSDGKNSYFSHGPNREDALWNLICQNEEIPKELLEYAIYHLWALSTPHPELFLV